jgi:outer membrane receptor protein involved in Fe transport
MQKKISKEAEELLTYTLRIKTIILALLFFITLPASLFAGTTGKISGHVTDETGEAVVGANIIVQGTYLGAATDINGYYFINNVQPGEHVLVASAVGYSKTKVQNVLIKIDLTTKINIKLTSTAVSLGQEVVVKADRPLVQKDLTSTSATISAGEMKLMPVENVSQVINLQAGVVGGHFRGGRSNEVAYLVDGVAVTDAYDNSMGIEIENSSVRQMEVISGTFNAEYGQAMSGVVNIVTQEGGSQFEGSVSGYAGNYTTSHSDLFQNLGKVWRIGSKNLVFSLGGPALLKNLTFFASGRYYKNEGYLYGKRVYNISDKTPTVLPNNMGYITHNTGDKAYVSMNPSEHYSGNGKLTYSLPLFKFSYGCMFENNWNKYYNHGLSQTPDGAKNYYGRNTIQSFQIYHYPNNSTYQSLKISYNYHKYYGYLYEDPYDTRYVNPTQGNALSSYTFNSGGEEGDRYDRYTKSLIVQYSLTSQLSKEHKIGIGFEGRLHEMFNHSWNLVNLTDGVTDTAGNVVFTPGYPNVGSVTDQGSNIQYTKKPREFSAYVQDKMEYDIMIINAGLRFDYFDANSSNPADLRNPRNNPDFPGANQYVKAKAKAQLSPRLGASFPITDQGIIRFSYGHFFQIPNYSNLYTNPDFIVSPSSSLSSVTGNPDLKPQKTVMYEIGLQQVLFPNVVLNFTAYYRDIRNLLGMEILSTYEGFKYARYINRDYGNVRGFIVSVDKRFADFFSARLDYTYQIAEGNASDPMSVYNNNQSDPPVEETKKVVSLDWDQRHTLNLSLTVGEPGDWTCGLIFSYGSGFPYTEDIRVSNGVRFENGGLKPPTYNVDLRADKTFKLLGVDVNTFLLIYNLLDIKNENGVYSTTGRANVDLNAIRYYKDSDVIGLNTIADYVKNPSMYSSPREIRVGFGFQF